MKATPRCNQHHPSRPTRRSFAALAVAIALALTGASGCGGGEEHRFSAKRSCQTLRELGSEDAFCQTLGEAEVEEGVR